ncbi:hypothetical protein [Amnibacterium sp.]|uniref:hypothetical protein n=1 Tax=Amnibacterium sp. TaxID=1872496 RepID=UPI003F7B6D12
MSAHTFLSASISRAIRVVLALPGEMRIASVGVASLAVITGVMFVNWRIGIPIALVISVTAVLWINAAMGLAEQGHGDLDSIECLLRENEATYPTWRLGFEIGSGSLLRSAQTLRARAMSRFSEPVDPVAHSAP